MRRANTALLLLVLASPLVLIWARPAEPPPLVERPLPGVRRRHLHEQRLGGGRVPAVGQPDARPTGGAGVGLDDLDGRHRRSRGAPVECDGEPVGGQLGHVGRDVHPDMLATGPATGHIGRP